jgi:hypothetical protein
MDRDLERQIIYAFQDSYPSCPAGVICESESPDFLLQTAQGTLGIEVTQLFRPRVEGEVPRQARERYAQELVQEARRLYEEGGGPPVDVAVLLNSGASPNSGRRRELANFIANAVLHTPVPDFTRVLIECDESNYREFPSEIAWVRAYRYGTETKACWVVQDFDWGMPCPPDEMESLIAQKEALLPSYRRQCDQTWLLVAVSVGGLSTRFENTGAQQPVGNSEFDRVVLFDLGQRHAVELWQASRAAT